LKVTLECAHCLLERAINQVKLATDDPGLRMRVVEAMTQFLGENFNGDAVPSHIGTDRDLLVQEMTGNDPYEELKHESNEMALGILPELQKLVDEHEDPKMRFRIATLITAAANAIEFDVSGREFSLDELRLIIDNVETDLAIDQVEEFMSFLGDVKEVLFLHDNAGEIVLDMILIREIRRIGPKVIAVVKGGPILNDATMVDAEEVGLSNCADEVRDKLFSSAELIIAKGMGNFESLTEFAPSCPTIHIMRTKCNPVAEHVGVPRNKNVVLIRMPPDTD
jgi:uncharacterized protein with ATP-grasp and redox domains